MFLFKQRILSMMNNEAAPSYFNGGSLTQYNDYRWVSRSWLVGKYVVTYHKTKMIQTPTVHLLHCDFTAYDNQYYNLMQ